MEFPWVLHQKRSVIGCQGGMIWFLLRVKEQGERDGQSDKQTETSRLVGE